MGIHERVRPVGRGGFGVGDRTSEPPVVGLSSKVQHPARDRDGYPVGGELVHEWVEPFFPGRFACDRYAAARRRTSFPCFRSLIRIRASRSSAASLRLTPGSAPASMSA